MTTDRDHEYFGRMIWDAEQPGYSTSLPGTNGAVSVSVTIEEPAEAEEALRLAAAMCMSATGWVADAKAYAAEEMLANKNENWLDEGEPELSAEDFMALMTLTSITFDRPSEFTLWFDDGDLFWGHTIMVDGSMVDGLSDAQICG